VVARILAISLFRIRVYGRKNILCQDGGALLMSNHQSYLDPIFVSIAIDREIHFLARKSLFARSPFGCLIKKLNAFPIQIENNYPDISSIKETIRRLKLGNFVLVFPEGTRTLDGKIGKVKPGVGVIGRYSDVPIIPILIEGVYEIWPRQNFVPFLPPFKKNVKIVIGKPFFVKNIDKNKMADILRSLLAGLVRC